MTEHELRFAGTGLLLTLGLAASACQSSTLPASHSADASISDASPSEASPGDAAPAEGGATACTIAPPAPADWRLHADGTLLRDSLGRVILLRGVDAGGRSKFSPYVPFDYPDGGYAGSLDAYMAHAQRWGIDAMRVPFTWAALEPTQGQDDAEWLARYDQLLDSAWAHGIWTILDFHQDIYSEVFCGDGFPGWTVPDAGPPHHDCPSWNLEYFSDPGVEAAFDAFWAPSSPVQAAYLAAWDVMIARYKDKPGVLGFEPINEPGWGTADESTFSATTLTAFYSSIVPHMRAAAPTSLVFVDPPGLDGASETTSLMKPTGDGVVFAPHYYPVSGSSANELAGLQAWATIGTTWNVPVIVGEFGAPENTNTDAAYMTAVFDALDALGLGGTQWEYSVSVDQWNSEIDSIVAGDGGEYPTASAVQRPFARAVAGSGVTEAFDATSKTFTLTFTPVAASYDGGTGGNVTEVSASLGAYPSGYEIALVGGCYDATSAPGKVLLQPAPGATAVTLTLTTK